MLPNKHDKKKYKHIFIETKERQYDVFTERKHKGGVNMRYTLQTLGALIPSIFDGMRQYGESFGAMAFYAAGGYPNMAYVECKMSRVPEAYVKVYEKMSIMDVLDSIIAYGQRLNINVSSYQAIRSDLLDTKIEGLLGSLGSLAKKGIKMVGKAGASFVGGKLGLAIPAMGIGMESIKAFAAAQKGSATAPMVPATAYQAATASATPQNDYSKYFPYIAAGGILALVILMKKK